MNNENKALTFWAKHVGLCIHGKKISIEKANEIIKRMEWGLMSNVNNPLQKELCSITHSPFMDNYDQSTSTGFRTLCNDIARFTEEWAFVDSEYLFSNWVYLGLPVHGFCHPDGTIYDCITVGYSDSHVKNFNIHKLNAELKNVMKAFPFLDLIIDVYDLDSKETEYPEFQIHARHGLIDYEEYEPEKWKNINSIVYQPVSMETVKMWAKETYDE